MKLVFPQHPRARTVRQGFGAWALMVMALLLGVCSAGLLRAQDVRSAGDRSAAPQAGALTVTGRVIDSESKEALVGVTVSVVGRVQGTITDGSGNYRLSINNPEAGLKLRFSYVGYDPQDVAVPANGGTVNVDMVQAGVMGKEVVVSASRVAESVLAAPVSVERLDVISIRESPSVNFYDAIANLKSVDMTTTSLGFKTVNARGFNASGNTRFVQLIDGMDNQAPGLNFSVGNIVGVTELDVASAELIPGSASALYGPNALNGILVMTTKDPFNYQGASAKVQFGVNHVDNFAREASPYIDAALRYAKAFNDKWAFKINVSYMQGQDWHADSRVNMAGLTNSAGINPTDPRRNQDLLNFYGDEVVADVAGAGNVSRTAYAEPDLVDYGVKSLRGNAQVSYRITDKIEASAFYSYGEGTTVYQGANRYSIRNFTFQQVKAEVRGDEFYLRGYMTIENSGESYDSRFLAQNINRQWVQGFNPATGANTGVVPETSADATWFSRYAFAFSPTGAGLLGGASFAGQDWFARGFADQGRLVPGQDRFDDQKNRIQGLTDFRRGAKFNDQTKMYHAEGQYNFKKLLANSSLDKLEVLVGANIRRYALNSNGTIFPDSAGNTIKIDEYGGFVSLAYRLLDDKLKLSASGRYDKNENYDSRFTPRFSAVYEVAKDHFIRASFTTGFRMPTTQEQFIDLDVGTARLLGANPAIPVPYDLQGNIWTLESVLNFSRQVTAAAQQFAAQNGRAPTSSEQAVIASGLTGALQLYNPRPIRPEYTETYELGYKGILDNKLFWDASYYFTRYYDFIGFQRVIRPNTPISGPNGSLAWQDLSSGQRQVFQLYVPAEGTVFSQGVNLGIEYAIYKGYRINANYTFAELILESSDPTFTAFNTPKHKSNFSFYNRNVVPNVGFNITWRWSDTYRWQASFGDGQVPAFNLLDAQVSFRIPDIKTIVKLGGSNILNNRHFEIWGGPNVGAMYYVAFTFDELFSN